MLKIIAGELRGRKLLVPKEKLVRPTPEKVRGAIFNILTNSSTTSLEGMRVLDVFCGSGAMGFEAISRGAEFACMIDASEQVIECVELNATSLDLGHDRIKTIRADALRLQPSAKRYNLAFLDPPYNKNMLKPALKNLDKTGWLEDGAILMLEYDERDVLDLPDKFRALDERKYGRTKIGKITYIAN